MGLGEFRAAARAWLEESYRDAPSNYGAIVPDDQFEKAVAWQRRLASAGLAGLHWPREWGGQGLSRAHTAAWLEECARRDVPPFLNMVGLVLAAEGLLSYGTDLQKSYHLPATRMGDRVWCQLFSEPDAGSDLRHLHTKAARRGGGWVLSGEKTWISNGHLADWGICLARTEASATSTHTGLSFFLVDMRTKGIGIRKIRQMTGAAAFDQVLFDHVEIPPDSLLGDEGAGWAVALSTLRHERNHIGAMAIQLGQRLDRLVHVPQSSVVARDRALRLWARGWALKMLGSQASRLGPAAASLMKLGVSELSLGIAELATDPIGAAGMLDGLAAAELLAASAARIAGGSTQIQKTIVGEQLLGLPREPKVISR